MDILTVAGLIFIGASLIHAQPQMPPIISNPGSGMSPGVRTPNQGSNTRPGIRPIGQGSGMPPGVRNPNSVPMIPSRGRNSNQGPALSPGARASDRLGPNLPSNLPPRNGLSGNMQGVNGVTGQCILAGNSATRECFQTYGVTRLQNVDALISSATNMPGSRSEAQIMSAICRNQGNIIGCMYNKIDGLRVSADCTSTREYTQLQQETVSRVSGIQEICGKGPLATPDTCVNDMDNNMRQCYQKLGLNPNLFSINGTTVLQASGPGDLIKSVIGTERKRAVKFCRGWVAPQFQRLKSQLFICMQQALSRCPAGQTLIEKNGYDQSTLKSGIDVLCHNVNDYLKSLRCSKSKSTEAQRCRNKLSVQTRELEEFNRRQSMPTYQYQTAQCQLKLEHMECDIAVWKKTCPDSVVGLKNEFECNALPTACKNNPNLQRNLTETCAIQKFQRHLRSGSSGHFSFSSWKIITLSVVSAVLLIL